MERFTVLFLICSLCCCGTGKDQEADIHKAAADGDVETVRKLLEKDPGLAKKRSEDRAHRGRTPLHVAGSAEVVKILIDAGADVHAKDDFDWTPLHTASCAEVAEFLIIQGADVNAKAQRQFTPLHTLEDPGAAEVVIERGGNVNKPTSQGITPIYWQLQYPHPKMVRVLLDHGADVSASKKDGRTLLHLAADRSSPESVKILLAKKLDPNAVDRIGAAPIHYAAFKGYTGNIKALLEAGANPNLKLSKQAVIQTFGGRGLPEEQTVAGYTALDLAKNAEAKALIRKHGGVSAKK
jgi:ankyrin repeat protein